MLELAIYPQIAQIDADFLTAWCETDFHLSRKRLRATV